MEWSALAIGIVASLLAAEVYSWLPDIAERLLRFHSSRVPTELADRLLEEWMAELGDTAGNIGKLLFALDLFRATPIITFEFYVPHVPFRPITDSALRFIDILFAAIGLFLAVPSLILIALAIKLEDWGPVLVYEQRVGRARKLFRELKFRTVYARTSEKNDILSHYTLVGWFLGKTALDELPQLFNILKGDMSFVGPRALSTAEFAAVDYPLFSRRYAVRPGLTGLAQIYSPRGLSPIKKSRYDVLYIKKRNSFLYLRLILLSFWITFRGKWDHKHNS